jgi:3-hydroxymyristoyl/3-hydroxydecanoyl-(acyl carrier protein) dehydratase
MIQYAKEIIRIVQKQSEKELQLQICFSESLPYFQGHFPGTPILPGIVQLNFAIDCATEYLLMNKTQIQSIPQIKFLNLIQTNKELILSLILEDNALKFSYANENKTFSHGKIILKDLIT